MMVRNATIQQGQAGQSITMSADIAVTDALTIDVQGENRQLNLSGQLSGSGNLTLRGVLGGRLVLNSAFGGFRGEVLVEDITVVNAAPGGIDRSNVRVSGALWSDTALNLGG